MPCRHDGDGALIYRLRAFTPRVAMHNSQRLSPDYAETLTAMIPIQGLLSRIRWDKEFGDAEFAIGYYDRVEDRIVLKSLAEIEFPKNSHNVFEWIDLEGNTHTVPLHRIKEVYRNGERIWQRTH